MYTLHCPIKKPSEKIITRFNALNPTLKRRREGIYSGQDAEGVHLMYGYCCHCDSRYFKRLISAGTVRYWKDLDTGRTRRALAEEED